MLCFHIVYNATVNQNSDLNEQLAISASEPHEDWHGSLYVNMYRDEMYRQGNRWAAPSENVAQNAVIATVNNKVTMKFMSKRRF